MKIEVSNLEKKIKVFKDILQIFDDELNVLEFFVQYLSKDNNNIIGNEEIIKTNIRESIYYLVKNLEEIQKLVENDSYSIISNDSDKVMEFNIPSNNSNKKVSVDNRLLMNREVTLYVRKKDNTVEVKNYKQDKYILCNSLS